MNCRAIKFEIEKFIREKSAGFSGVILGISGGVDSAVVSYLAVNAIGPKKVKGLLMPYGKQKDIADAKMVATKLKIKYQIINIKPIVEQFIKTGCFGGRNSTGNLMARIRMILLYGVANSENRIVLGAGNKTEISVGYFTKYGDGGADILPIGDLYKTEIWELAKYLGVPEKIINKIPTAGLWKGQTDEGEMGVTYADLDAVLKGFARSADLIKKVVAMQAKSEHKRQLPPIAKIENGISYLAQNQLWEHGLGGC